MNKKLKLSTLALLAATAVGTASADTNLLQAVTVQFTAYAQGTPATNGGGDVINIINHTSYGTKDLIKDLTGSAPNPGDMLVHVTPVSNLVTYTTNLVPVSTNILVITNPSTNGTNYNLVLNGETNAIGNTNLTFGTNIVDIGSNSVTLGTNTVTVGTNASVGTNTTIGTNTTVTVTTLTNGSGTVGTNYTFVINALDVVATGTNKLGTAYWAIYNHGHHGSLTPISTNVYFNIHTTHFYTLTNPAVPAYIHGETIKHNGQIKFGQTDEIRSLTLSNSTSQVRLVGYAHGSIVAVSLGKTASAEVVNSQNYHWTGSGSGVVKSNTLPVVVEGTISEVYTGLKD